MARQVRDQEGLGEARRHEHVDLGHQIGHRPHELGADAVGVDVVDGGDESGVAEHVGPGVPLLPHHPVYAPGPREAVEGRRRLGLQDHPEGSDRDSVRHLDRLQVNPEAAEHVERRPVRLGSIAVGLVEGRLEHAHAEVGHRGGRVVGERGVRLGDGAADGVENEGAVRRAPGHRAELVHAPRECHRAVGGHAPERRPKAGDAVPRRRGDDRPQSLAADRERDEARRNGRARPRARPAGPLVYVPGVLRHAAEPDVAPRERAERQLRDEDGAGGIEATDHLGVGVEGLLPVRFSAPRGWVAGDCEEVLGAPRDAMEGTAVSPSGQFGVEATGLRQRPLRRERDDGLELRVEPLQPREKQLGQFDARDRPSAEHRPQLRDRGKREVPVVARAPRSGRHRDLGPHAGSRPRLAAQPQVEDECQRHAVGRLRLPDRREVVQPLVHVVEHHLALLEPKLEPLDRLGVCEVLDRDLVSGAAEAGRLGGRPGADPVGVERRGEGGGGEGSARSESGGDEAAAGGHGIGAACLRLAPP